MVSSLLELRNSSCLKNEASGHIILGGIMVENCGRIDIANIATVESRLDNCRVTVLCTTKSKFYNNGSMSLPSPGLSAKVQLNIGDNYFGNKDFVFRKKF